MTKETKYLYEEPRIYDGWCATVYTDNTFELRDHWAVNRLDEDKKRELSERIQKLIDNDAKEQS